MRYANLAIRLFGILLVAARAVPAYGGDYVTFKDPRTGVIYFGDKVPASTFGDAKVEVRRHEPVSTVGNNWMAREAAVTRTLQATAPKPGPVQGPQAFYVEPPMIGENQRILDELDHYSRKPSEPSRDRVAREFNIRTDQYRKYEEDMFEWRSRGRELRQKYQAPYGFGRYPTGFNEQEIRRLERK